MTKIGYARVSTKDQNLDLQVNELTRNGCEKLYKDQGVSGAKFSRPALDKMLSELKSGDVVVIWKLDRLGRSLKDLVLLVEDFNKKGIGLISLHDPIDTTTAQGRLVFNIFASLAEFERELISERTIAGLEAAKEKGRIGGRRAGLSPEAQDKAAKAKEMHSQGIAIPIIIKKLDISRKTFYNYLKIA